MTERACELHGIPLADVLDYLTKLGGTPGEPGKSVTVMGQGWQVHLSRLPDYHLGQAALCSVRVAMQGEDAVVREVWRKFELCVLRPGG